VSNAARALAGSTATGSGNRGQICPTCPYVQQRSDADHRMFWSLMEIAHSSWPEHHEFQPLGKMHLYGWLLTEAGWHEPPIEIESRNPDFIREIVTRIFPALKSKIHCIRFIPTAKGVTVLIPKSLDYKTAGKRQFEDVRSAVYDVIESVLGVPIETMKHEAKAA
jgi:hypothetical protein